MSKICGYSCKHNKSGVCQISVCDKKSIISDKTEVQTLRLDELDYTIVPNSDIKPLLDKLQQENQQLKGFIQTYDILLKANVEENKQLKEENQELKSQLKGTTHCYDEEEHEKLKKQLEELKEEKQEWINLLAMFKNQQKEFIEYLEDYLKLFDNMCIDEQGYYDMLEEILNKYKEIIGGKNEIFNRR